MIRWRMERTYWFLLLLEGGGADHQTRKERRVWWNLGWGRKGRLQHALCVIGRGTTKEGAQDCRGSDECVWVSVCVCSLFVVVCCGLVHACCPVCCRRRLGLVILVLCNTLLCISWGKDKRSTIFQLMTAVSVPLFFWKKEGKHLLWIFLTVEMFWSAGGKLQLILDDCWRQCWQKNKPRPATAQNFCLECFFFFVSQQVKKFV